jgi:hypothetical protein
MEHPVKTLYRWLIGAGIMFGLYGTAVVVLTRSKGFSLVDPKSINVLFFSLMAAGVVIAMRIAARPWLNSKTKRSTLTSVLQMLALAIIGAGCLAAATWIAAGRPDVQIHSR